MNACTKEIFKHVHKLKEHTLHSDPQRFDVQWLLQPYIQEQMDHSFARDKMVDVVEEILRLSPDPRVATAVQEMLAAPVLSKHILTVIANHVFFQELSTANDALVMALAQSPHAAQAFSFIVKYLYHAKPSSVQHFCNQMDGQWLLDTYLENHAQHTGRTFEQMEWVCQFVPAHIRQPLIRETIGAMVKEHPTVSAEFQSMLLHTELAQSAPPKARKM